jgi:uncharacterized protein (TIGR03067 family)
VSRLPLTASAVVVVLSLPVLHAGDDAKKQAVQKELKRLEGTWGCRWLGRNGKKFEADGGLLTIKGRRWYVGEKAVASFTIDPTTTPKVIDVTDLLEENGLMAEGIYRLDGDRLVICLYAGGGVRQRPLEFATELGSEKFLYWYERVQAGR